MESMLNNPLASLPTLNKMQDQSQTQVQDNLQAQSALPDRAEGDFYPENAEASLDADQLSSEGCSQKIKPQLHSASTVLGLGGNNTRLKTFELTPHMPNIDEVKLEACQVVYEDGKYNIRFNAEITAPCPVLHVGCLCNNNTLGYLEFESPPNDSTTFKISGRVFFTQNQGAGSSYVGRPFLMLCDLVMLSFVIKFVDGSTMELYTQYLLCASQNKEDTENIKLMLRKLAEFDNSQISSWLFAENQASLFAQSQELLNHQTHRSLNSYLQLIEEIIACYQSNLPYFRRMGKHTIKKESVLQSPLSVKSVTFNSFQWLMQNSDQLSPVNSSKGIYYQGQNYVPLQISSEVNIKSLDVYENRVVLYFLSTVLSNVKQVYADLQADVSLTQQTLATFNSRQAAELQEPPQSETSELLEPKMQASSAEADAATRTEQMETDANAASSTGSASSVPAFQASGLKTPGSNESIVAQYESPILRVKTLQIALCQGFLSRLNNSIGALTGLMGQYMNLFDLKPMLMLTLPRKTKTFQELKPYTQVFTVLLKWFNYGELKLEKDKLMLQVKTLDKLFEYFCLIELLNMLTDNGYQLSLGPTTSRSIYREETKEEATEARLQSKLPSQQPVSAPAPERSDSKGTVTATVAAIVTATVAATAVATTTTNQAESITTVTSTQVTTTEGPATDRANTSAANTSATTTTTTEEEKGPQITTPIYTFHYHTDNVAYQSKEDVPNTFLLRKGNVAVTLYYQPLISATEFQNQLSLYRTTNPHLTSDYYVPDFVLKFTNAQQEENYVILDAKFSTRSNILNRYLSDVIRKYSVEVAVNQSCAAPKMVWILQGRVSAQESALWQYHSSPLAMRHRPTTTFGVLAMNALDSNKQRFWDEIKRSIPWV